MILTFFSSLESPDMVDGSTSISVASMSASASPVCVPSVCVPLVNWRRCKRLVSVSTPSSEYAHIARISSTRYSIATDPDNSSTQDMEYCVWFGRQWWGEEVDLGVLDWSSSE